MKSTVVVAALMLVSAQPAVGQAAETVFRGKPDVRISEVGVTRVPVELSPAEADGYLCVISKIGDRYYWASREDREMIRVAYGSFVTYTAVDGSGYVRHIVPSLKAAASVMSEAEANFDYVEHLLVGLASITYYGQAQ